MDKSTRRKRRTQRIRRKQADCGREHLFVHRTLQHIYAQVISMDGDKVLASASTLDKDVRSELKNGSNIAAATAVGKRIAEKAKQAGVVKVAFNRSGNRYHGRVKALADAARENGLEF